MILKETLRAIDDFIAKCDAAPDDVALRQCFADTPSFTLPACHLDPLAPAYRDFVSHLYAELANIPYSTTNEYIRLLPPEEELAEAGEFKYKRPFPFCTSTPATTSMHLRSIADIISHLPYHPGGKIL